MLASVLQEPPPSHPGTLSKTFGVHSKREGSKAQGSCSTNLYSWDLTTEARQAFFLCQTLQLCDQNR